MGVLGDERADNAVVGVRKEGEGVAGHAVQHTSCTAAPAVGAFRDGDEVAGRWLKGGLKVCPFGLGGSKRLRLVQKIPKQVKT